MELAEIGRCRASGSPPQTHQGGLLSSIDMAVAVFGGCPRWSETSGASKVELEAGGEREAKRKFCTIERMGRADKEN